MANIRQFRSLDGKNRSRTEIGVWGCPTDSKGAVVSDGSAGPGSGSGSGSYAITTGSSDLEGAVGRKSGGFNALFVPFEPVSDEDWQVSDGWLPQA